MKKLLYKSESFYSSDINDMIEDLAKGGPGSGVRGHTTAKDGGSFRNARTGKMVPTEQFYDETATGLTRFSGFDGRPGEFMSFKQVINAVGKETGHSGPIAIDIARELQRRGRVKLIGKTFVVMAKKK